MSNLKYINVSKKRLVGRSNQTVPPLCIDYSTLFDISFQFIDERNQIIPLDSSLSGFAFAGSLKMGDMSTNLLWLCQDFSIEDNTLTFHDVNTFTVPFMAQIKKKNTEVNIEISQMSLNTKKVWLRDFALCEPRVWVAGLSPAEVDSQAYYTKVEVNELLTQNLSDAKDYADGQDAATLASATAYTDEKISELDLDDFATDADLQAAKTELDGKIALKQDKITSENKLPYSLVSDTPTIPTKTSELTNDSGYQTAQDVQNAISGKADQSALTAHTSDATIHVTAADKTAWNGKLDPSALNGYATEQYVNGQVSGKADKSYVDTELAKKQNTITSENKLPYSLISDTPDLSIYATEADLQTVSEAVDEKLDNPSGGTAGQVLTKTADGAEWADAQGGGEVNPAYVELEEKTASTPATFEVDFSGKQIQKYPFEDAASGSIAFTVKNSGASGDGYAPTVELQVPVSGEVSTITLPEGAQVVDMPASLTGELSNDRIKKGITYHDLVFRNEKNFAGHWQTYISHGYSFQELEEYDYFWLEAREDDSTVSCDNFNASYNLSSSFDRLTWTALTGSTIATGVSAGTKIYFIGNTTTLGTRYNGGGWRPYSDKKYAIGGKILSLYNDLIEPVTLTNQYDLIRWQSSKNLEECSVDFGPVKNIYEMFGGCSKLSALTDRFSCPNATNTRYMFNNCSKLSALPDSFSCPNTTDTNNMFYNCSSLSALPDSFSCPNTTDTNNMFRGCSSLSALPDGFSCPNATNTRYMFNKCSKLSALPADFSCPNATSTEQMFYGCSSLSALPDGFSCPNTNDTGYMFYRCSSLTTIGSNVKIANGANATTTDNTNMDKSTITTIGANFEWFTNATFDGTWDPALGIRNVFPNAVNVGSGWKVYNHYDGE